MSFCGMNGTPQVAPPLSGLQRCTSQGTQGAAAEPLSPCPSFQLAMETKEGDGPNGQHHLLRHVLSPQQCNDALRHFRTGDPKAAARMVNRMNQRELREMFAKVYSVTTNSNNNTWLRRKLLEAIGASRRFYNAASKPARAKGSRRPGGAAAAPGGRAKPSTPHQLVRPAMAPGPLGRHQPATPQALVVTLHHPAAPAASNLALPAGSPRALTQRLRTPRARCSPPPDCGGVVPASTPVAPQRSPFHLHRKYSSEAETCSEHSGSDVAHSAALAAPRAGSLDSGTPTSRLAAVPAVHPQEQQPGLGLTATYSMGSDSSLVSSQFLAQQPLGGALLPPQLHESAFRMVPLVPPQPDLAVSHPPLPALLPWQLPVKPPPRNPSLASLAALLSGQPLAECAAASLPLPPPEPAAVLPPSASVDLGLAGAIEASAGMLAPHSLATLPLPPRHALDQEDWLEFDDFVLPSLF